MSEPTTASIPTMRVAVELTYVRCCEECRGIAERAAVAAIHDASVTAFRAVPGTKHAHPPRGDESLPKNLGGSGPDQMFIGIPTSDTNGFDPQGRA